MANSNSAGNLEAIHSELCKKLDIDKLIVKKTWDAYVDINGYYTLDGDPLHWLACSLYVECLNYSAKPVKVGLPEGAKISLAKLLRIHNISLIQLLNKFKRWTEMATIPTFIRLKIEKVERKFNVSTLLYQKFQPIFHEIFTNSCTDNLKRAVKKSRSINMQQLYKFTWCLYVCVKEEFHNTADNLVDMYHILLSCFDYVFNNVFIAEKVELLNPEFKGLPKDFNSKDYVFPNTSPCIIPTLCEMMKCSLVEVSTAKQYSWKPIMETFFEKNILKGDKRTLTGILDMVNYEDNLKSLKLKYETYILRLGEFDETLFLEDTSFADPTIKQESGDMDTFTVSSCAVAPDTPLTGRRYLRGPAEPLTPVSEATNSIARLRTYLSGSKPHPSAQLIHLFTECGVNSDMVESCVTSPCTRWMQQFASSLQECSTETVISRTNMVTTLHYKVLEHILREERRKKPHVSLQSLLKQEVFQVMVYACCAEVVLHAYGSHAQRFPRILSVFQISAFHFYKIIELVVLATMEKLSRDVIKHLNAVEEQVLESLVWTSDSPLWERLKTDGDSVIPTSGVVYNSIDSPLPTPQQRRNNVMQSPVSTATDRFVPPVVDQAKKQLFKDNIRPGQSLLVSPAQPSISQIQPENSEVPTTPKKGSLVLFFRKFYSLAVVRMNYLCDSLSLSDHELRMKIWTCLEHSLVQQTHLMKDRHLDQILMCAVYVICKVSNSATNPVERSFTEIMRCYRQQPQADNHVYRSVLIGVEKKEERGDLIKFYNKVYVQCMQTFALRFTGRNRDQCSLSPLPAGRGSSEASPARTGQRVSERHQVFVRPLTSPPPRSHHLSYRFSRSPAKDLHAINSMLSCEMGILKRPSSTLDESVVKRASFDTPAGVTRKLQVLITDRQAV